MSKSRLEAFTDGVIAIIITILVLGIDVPEEASFAALWEQRTQFLVYVVSFVILAIYWNNHHHLLQIAHRISGEVMWCNIILLLFLSLFPFTTAWVNTNLFARTPELLYGGVMLLADVVWLVLAHALVRENGKDSAVSEALRDSRKSSISIALVAIGLVVG
ncbi:MAG: TMEM175 family protein, partial [Coriobacteriales bacterium]|nr:TMEM175 family protein [Coriobacteriales bacterium]